MKAIPKAFCGTTVADWRITMESKKIDAAIVTLSLEVKVPMVKDWAYVKSIVGVDMDGDTKMALAKAMARVEADWNITLSKEPEKLLSV